MAPVGHATRRQSSSMSNKSKTENTASWTPAPEESPGPLCLGLRVPWSTHVRCRMCHWNASAAGMPRGALLTLTVRRTSQTVKFRGPRILVYPQLLISPQEASGLACFDGLSGISAPRGLRASCRTIVIPNPGTGIEAIRLPRWPCQSPEVSDNMSWGQHVLPSGGRTQRRSKHWVRGENINIKS